MTASDGSVTRPSRPRARVPWLPTGVAATVERVTFEVQRASLAGVVADTSLPPQVHRQVGLLRVLRDDEGGCTLLEVDGAGFLSSAGFAHCAGPPPADDESYTYEPLSGPWYTYSYDPF